MAYTPIATRVAPVIEVIAIHIAMPALGTCNVEVWRKHDVISTYVNASTGNESILKKEKLNDYS